jgi:outer membrane protein assembly factor BamD
MLKFRKTFYLLIVILSTSACSEYSRVLNKGTSSEQLNMATTLFDEGKYAKALVLFEKIMPDYQGKGQMERIQYMISESYFYTEDYLMAAYHFDRFIKNYPRSTKKEDASYKTALSYYLSTPRSGLDQSNTNTAIESFQRFIDKYPASDKIAETNKYVKEMQMKLEKKEFDIAYQYYHTEQYKAAIVAFDNFISDNLGTSYKEEALYYRAKAANDLALNSVNDKKQSRINDALAAFEKLERNFKNSKYKTDIEKMKKKLNDELTTLKSVTQN